MIPHNMTLFKFICVQYQFHCQTLPIMKIDRGQIQFRDYVSTGTEPNDSKYIDQSRGLGVASGVERGYLYVWWEPMEDIRIRWR